MRWLARTLVGFLAVCCGCIAWRTARPELPRDYVIRLDQLVIHSNFEIPRQHRLLQEVDALRLDVSGKLGLPTSDEAIHVYLFEDQEQYGAFIHKQFPSFPDRRAFFVESDTKLAVYAHWGENVAVDLRHEVTHGYLHSMLRNLPLWLDEGLAEFFEMPRGQHGYHRLNIDALMAASAAGKWHPDIHRLEALKSVAQMRRVEYAEAWAWVHLLLETEPSRQVLLHDYLVGLRRDGVAGPLSQPLAEAHLDDPQLLLDHVRKLAADPPS